MHFFITWSGIWGGDRSCAMSCDCCCAVCGWLTGDSTGAGLWLAGTICGSSASSYRARSSSSPMPAMYINLNSFITPSVYSKNISVTALIWTYLSKHVAHYTECHRRNGPNFGRVFLMLNYTDITQNTYIQSWTVTEIMAREIWNFDSCYKLTDYQIHIETGRNMWFL